MSHTLTEEAHLAMPLGELFEHMPAEALEHLEKLMVHQRYAAKSVLFREGRPSNGVYLVRSGRVKLSLHCSHGKSLVVQFAGPGEPLEIGRAHV